MEKKIYDYGRYHSENFRNDSSHTVNRRNRVNNGRSMRNAKNFQPVNNSNNDGYRQLVGLGSDLEVGDCACYTKTVKICRGECENGNGGCTYTQGYWKNHPEAWPVDNLTLGSENYTQAELLDILDEPVAGNGLISLAHQLIAAKLNVANGADASPISSTVANADSLIGAQLVPPIGAGYLDPSSTSALTTLLDAYNNGLLGVPHCD